MIDDEFAKAIVEGMQQGLKRAKTAKREKRQFNRWIRIIIK